MCNLYAYIINDEHSLDINLITNGGAKAPLPNKETIMVYIDGKPTDQPCFEDVDVFKDGDGEAELIIHF